MWLRRSGSRGEPGVRSTLVRRLRNNKATCGEQAPMADALLREEVVPMSDANQVEVPMD